jgi:hypothetical protein
MTHYQGFIVILLLGLIYLRLWAICNKFNEFVKDQKEELIWQKNSKTHSETESPSQAQI